MSPKQIDLYQLNPSFIDPFLDSIPNQDSKIFLALCLCFMAGNEFSIDVQSIAELVNLPDDFVQNAIQIYIDKGILLKVQDINSNTEETLPY